MKKISYSIAVVFATVSLLVSSAVSTSAQTLPSLSVGTDAAGFSTGGATVAGHAGAYSLENNVAGMSFINGRMAAAASFVLWQPEYGNEKVSGAGVSVKVLEKLALGLTFKHFAYPSYNVTTESGAASRDGSFRPTEFNFALGSSYAVTGFLSLGLTARLLHSSLAADVSANVFGVDLAAYFRMKGISAGISVNNLGTKAKFGESSYVQPMLAKFGAGYNLGLGRHSVFMTAETDILFSDAATVGVGAEYSFRNLLFIRGGYHYGNASKGVIPSYASLGFGVMFFGVSIDAAYLFASSVLKNSFALSVGYAF